MPIKTMTTTNNYYSNEDLRNTLRLLWIEKFIWTRFYLVSRFAGLDDIVILSNRIYESAISIANLFNLYYGSSAKQQIENFLRQDISYNLSYIDSLLTKETELSKDIIDKWKLNAMELANYLSTINKEYNKDDLYQIFSNLIDLNIHEANKRLDKDYVTDIGQFDLIAYLSNSLSDYLWSGIINTFYRNK